jgi:hypothetical protein
LELERWPAESLLQMITDASKIPNKSIELSHLDIIFIQTYSATVYGTDNTKSHAGSNFSDMAHVYAQPLEMPAIFPQMVPLALTWVPWWNTIHPLQPSSQDMKPASRPIIPRPRESIKYQTPTVFFECRVLSQCKIHTAIFNLLYESAMAPLLFSR